MPERAGKTLRSERQAGMKLVLGTGLILSLLAFTAIEAPAVDAESNSPEERYQALIQYFRGEIDRDTLEEILDIPAPVIPTGPTPASTALIGNTGQTPTSSPTDNDYAQGFTTGPVTGDGVDAWAITSVRLSFDFQVSNPATRPTLQVKIHEGGSGGRPDPTILGTFSRAGALANGLNTFTATGTAPILLDPGTHYVLVVDVIAQSSNSGNDVQVRLTNSDAEDAGGAASWSIADTGLERQFQSTAAYSFTNESLLISVSGYAATRPPPPPAAFSQTLKQLSEAGRDVAQSTYECGGRPNPKLEAFYRDPLGFNWNSGETLYCDLSTGQWVPGRVPQAGVDFARDDQLIAPGASGYNEACYFTDAEGNRTPLARSVTNPDGSWARNSDGSRIFIITEGAHWDPIAQQCVQRTR